MRNDPIVVQPFQGRRVHLESYRTFEEVLADAAAPWSRSLCRPTRGGGAGGLNLKAFEAVVRSQVGEAASCSSGRLTMEPGCLRMASIEGLCVGFSGTPPSPS